MAYSNPILPGFYPDPSCIRVGDTFYMINSSFQLFPGLPIHRSKDLINWELIGHAVNRPDQVDLTLATTKINNAARGEVFTAGLYAPVLRHHVDTFYIVCTMLTGRATMASDEDFAPQNFIIKAKDLTDPSSLSQPINFDFFGIDPSLLFDDDGRVYIQGSFIFGYKKKPATTIKQAEIDLETGRYKSDLREIWGGSGGKCPEGPHVYKKDGMYWLLLAEGGTHRGHSITLARADNPWGPFESFQGNPILTTQGPEHPIQCVGHGELFDDTDGNWWCTMLARREFGKFYPLGRETYLAPASWPIGEFPTIDHLELQQAVGSKRNIGQISSKQKREVTLDSLHTVYIRSPLPDCYREVQGHLLLQGTEATLQAAEGPITLLGHRQTSLNSKAEVIISLDSLSSECYSGLAVYSDSFRHIALQVGPLDQLSLIVTAAGKSPHVQKSVKLSDHRTYKLSITSTVECYSFHYAAKVEEEWLDDVFMGLVSTEIFSGDDFTSPIYGIYVVGEGTTKFSNFSVTEL